MFAAPLPALPGYTPPILLDEFLQHYFFIRHRTWLPSAIASALDASLVWVYVSGLAPPPTLPREACFATAAEAMLNSNNTIVPTTTDSVPSLSPPSSAAAALVHSARPASSLLLPPRGNHGAQRKATQNLLDGSRLWSALASVLPQRVVSFIVVHCVVVQQFPGFAGCYGALHICGDISDVALTRHASATQNNNNGVVFAGGGAQSSSRRSKRGRGIFFHPVNPHPAKQHRSEILRRQSFLCRVLGANISRAPFVELGRIDTTHEVLYKCRRFGTSASPTLALLLGGAELHDNASSSSSNNIAEERSFILRNALLKLKYAKLRRAQSGGGQVSSTTCGGSSYVHRKCKVVNEATELLLARYFVPPPPHKPPPPQQKQQQQQQQQQNDRWKNYAEKDCIWASEHPHVLSSARKAKVAAVLRDLTTRFLELDLRGIVISCFQHMELKFATSSVVVVSAGECVVSKALLTQFLTKVFGALQQENRQDDERKSNNNCRFTLGDGANVKNFVSACVEMLLQFGIRGLFPCHRFVNKIKLSAIPWLKQLAGSTHQHTNMQKLFGLLTILLAEEVLPVILCECCAVTSSPRFPNQLVFIPRYCWAMLRAAETRKRLELRPLAETGQEEQNEVANRGINGEGKNSAPSSSLIRCFDPHLDPAYIRYCAASSALPKGGQVICSEIRYRVDATKLRPIAQVTCRSEAQLMHLQRCEKFEGKGHHAAIVPLRRHVTATSENYSLRNSLSPSSSSFVGNQSSSSAAGAASHVLRKALLCLHAGQRERRSKLGLLTPLSNMTHCDEYRNILHFILDVRRTAAASKKEGRRGCGGVIVYLLRCDGQKCYEMLPQAAVREAINRTVSHRAYFQLRFRALYNANANASSASGDNKSGGNEEDQRQCCCRRANAKKQKKLVVRHWSATLTDDEYQQGVVRGIPSGWIVSEQPGCIAEFNGHAVRAVLEEHVTNHVVSLDGKLMVQRVGIIQGSPVAPLLCDAVLEGVDEDVTSLLDTEEEQDSSSGSSSGSSNLYLRRVDDVLVGTTSLVAADEAKARVLRGWPQLGYVSNPSKMETASSSNASPGGSSVVSWCGVRIHVNTNHCPAAAAAAIHEKTGERQEQQELLCYVTADWSRLAAVADLSALVRSKPGTESDLILSSIRLVRIIQMRTPGILFCSIINPTRVICCTLLEIGFIWASCLVNSLCHDEQRANFRPHPRVVLRPLAIASSALFWHVQRKIEENRTVTSLLLTISDDVRHHNNNNNSISHHSDDEITRADVELCLLQALDVLLLHEEHHREARRRRAKTKEGDESQNATLGNKKWDVFFRVVLIGLVRRRIQRIATSASASTEGKRGLLNVAKALRTKSGAEALVEEARANIRTVV